MPELKGIYTDEERELLQAAHRLIVHQDYVFAIVPLANPPPGEPTYVLFLRRTRQFAKVERLKTVLVGLKRIYQEASLRLNVNRSVLGKARFDEEERKVVLTVEEGSVVHGVGRALYKIAKKETLPRFARCVLKADGEIIEEELEEDEDEDSEGDEGREEDEPELPELEQLSSVVERTLSELSDEGELGKRVAALEAAAEEAIERALSRVEDQVSPAHLREKLPPDLKKAAQALGLALASVQSQLDDLLLRIEELAEVLEDREQQEALLAVSERVSEVLLHTRFTALSRALADVARAEDEEARQAALEGVASHATEYADALDDDPRMPQLKKNPFRVSVDVPATLGRALRAVASAAAYRLT